MRPENFLALSPARAVTANRPIAANRVHFGLRRLEGLGLTQRPLTRRPGRARWMANTTRAASDSRKRKSVPLRTLVATGFSRAPRRLIANVAGLSDAARNTGG